MGKTTINDKITFSTNNINPVSEVSEKTKQSAWTLIINTNICVRPSDPPEVAPHYAKAFGETIDKIFSNKNSVIDAALQFNSRVRKDIDWFDYDCGVEFAPDTGKLHAHMVLLVLHRSKILLCSKKLQRYIRDTLARDHKIKIPGNKGGILVKFTLIPADKWESTEFTAKKIKDYLEKNSDLKKDEADALVEQMEKIDKRSHLIRPESSIQKMENKLSHSQERINNDDQDELLLAENIETEKVFTDSEEEPEEGIQEVDELSEEEDQQPEPRYTGYNNKRYGDYKSYTQETKKRTKIQPVPQEDNTVQKLHEIVSRNISREKNATNKKPSTTTGNNDVNFSKLPVPRYVKYTKNKL